MSSGGSSPHEQGPGRHGWVVPIAVAFIGAMGLVLAALIGILGTSGSNQGSEGGGSGTSTTSEADRLPPHQAANPVARRLELPEGYSVDLDNMNTSDVRSGADEDTDLSIGTSSDNGLSVSVINSFGSDNVRLVVLDPKIPLDPKASLIRQSPVTTSPGAHPAIIYSRCVESTLFTQTYEAVRVGDQFCVRASENRVVFLRVVRIRSQSPRAVFFETLTWTP